jgi:glycosyltransferase involved in cell wall biosynthesis
VSASIQNFIVITPHEYFDMRNAGIQESKVSLVPPCIYPYNIQAERTAVLGRFGVPDKKIVLFVGRLSWIKGPDTAIKVFSKLLERCDCHMIMVGPDEGMLNFCTNIINRLNLSKHITIISKLDHDSIYSLCGAADVMLVTSRSESASMSIAEAQSCGLPIVARNVGGIRYMFRNGISGYLVESDHVNEYVNLLLGLLTSNSLRKQFALASRAWSHNFSPAKSVDSLLRVYSKGHEIDDIWEMKTTLYSLQNPVVG